MLCFEVWLNGEKKLLAGHEDADDLGLSIETLEEEAFLETTAGIWKNNSLPDYLFWESVNFKIGDEITIKILDSRKPDPPTRISRNQEVVEKPKNHKEMLCSSCKKSFFDTDSMMKMPGVILCNECIGLIKDFMSDYADDS